MYARSALEDRKIPNKDAGTISFCNENFVEKKIRWTMKNWRFAIQPIVYTFPRWRFTSFNTGWVLLLPPVPSSLSFSRSDDNEVGEMRFATRHERVPRESIFLPPLFHATLAFRCKSHVAILRS